MRAIRDSSLKKKALKSLNNWKHLAVLIDGGRIILTAINDDKGHAERNLLAEYEWLTGETPKGRTVLSVRVKKDGSFANAKPCKNCWRLLKEAGVKKVRWTTPGDITIGWWAEERL